MMSVDKITTPQTLSQLLQGLSNIPSQYDVKVTGISADSRKVKSGDLFIAYNDSGFMNYVKSAIESGVSAVVLELEQTPDIPKHSVPVIALPQLRAQAGLIAARFFKNPSHVMNVIGVTGTNGKTTVSYLIAQAFNDERQGKSGLIGTLGCGPFDQLSTGPNTTPESVSLQNTFAELREQGIDVVAMEVSSHGLDQYRVSGVEFDIAVFTNLSRDHLDYHQTMENYAESKRRLFSDYSIKQAIINIDDTFGRARGRRPAPGCRSRRSSCRLRRARAGSSDRLLFRGGVEPDGDRAVVDQADRHMGLELAGLDGDAVALEVLAERGDQRLGDVGRRGAGEARVRPIQTSIATLGRTRGRRSRKPRGPTGLPEPGLAYGDN